MAAFKIRLPYALPFEDPSYSPPTIGGISAPSSARLLPVGEAFRHHAARVLKGRTLEEHEEHVSAAAAAAKASAEEGQVEEVDDGVGEEPESRALLASDPREWKNQDQYAVLGLSSLRYKATQDQIKRAYTKKVLRHHPDKKAGQAGNANDDSFFKCISKAFETLSDPVKRRQFDSVDEGVDDDDVPNAKQAANPEEFLSLYSQVFEREARFSNKTPVPTLGNMDSSRTEVEEFYDFWLTFDSWRSFEWKDKDANEGSDSRNEKRHIENKNRSERERRKKEDNARRRNLVETALQQDPRMKKFKAEERAAREAKKKGGAPGSDAVKLSPAELSAQKAAKEKEEAAAKAAAEKQAADDKAAREAAKKSKEAAKKNLKREKKVIAGLVTSLNYFLPDGENASASTIETQLSEVDTLLAALEPEDVAELRKEMEAAKDQGGKVEVKRVLVSYATKATQSGRGGFKEFV